MTRLVSRRSSPRLQWQLEQQGVHPLLARLYAARGVSSRSEVEYGLDSLLSPSTLTHAAAAARLLADAIAARARILIVADYDCDGATACAVGLRALRAFGARVDYLVPNRFTCGYGLSPDVVDLAAARQPDLIVTVDNGVGSVDGVARARQLGIATLITDHHLPGDALPAADCLVNPNLAYCDFASKHLAGVGVIFYVMLALRAELRQRHWFDASPEPALASLLDLVAVGTVADVVRLDHNNRVLVSHGLQRIRQGRLSPGLRALFHAAGRDPQRASIFDLGFAIAPRLNAAGRLADMSLGIECLITDDDGRALNLAQRLDALNRERREIEAGMQQQALAQLADADLEGDGSLAGLALWRPDWHQGVIGIVAGRIREKVHRPVFAFADSQSGEITGSGRSIPGLHLRDALDLVGKRAPGLLLRFGGHAMAAGVTLRGGDFHRFRELFAAVVDELLSPADRCQTLETDGGLETAYVSVATARLLDGEIWGQGFPPPVFADDFLVDGQRIVKEKHLKLRLRRGTQTLDAIQFNFAEAAGDAIRAAYRLTINDYGGIQSPQLTIEHFEPG